MTVGQYVLEAVEERLQQDLRAEHEGALALTQTSDPVLAELWNNPRDARYDEA